MDTLFDLSSKNALKYYRRTYFLNYKSPCGGWTTHLLHFLKGDTLEILKIEPEKSNFDYIEKIINLEDSTNTFLAIPTKKEIRKNYLKTKELEHGDKYLKLD